jgi:PAS domain S-box-containing protein
MSADATAFLSGDSRGPGHVRIPAAQYESLLLLSSIVSSSDDAIVSATINGQVTSWNGAAEHLFGYSAQEMIGQSLMRLVSNSGDRELRRSLTRISRGERVGNYQAMRCCKNGRQVPVLASMSPLRDAANQIVGVAEISRDLFSLEQAERDYRTHEKLRAMARLASRLAHDINNPLTSVTNLLYLLEGLVLSEKAARYVELAHRELWRVARISAQALNLHYVSGEPASILLSDLIDEALAQQEDRCSTMGIHVQREYRAVPTIRCYAAEMRQVLANLLDNAVDAMPAGGRLRVRLRECSQWAGKGRCLRITIGDTGRGMSAEIRRRLFEPFFTTKQATGTGLGLWGCAHIVNRYGGRILLRSRQSGQSNGSVFMLILPL